MPPGGRYQAHKTNNQTKEGKLDGGRFHRSVDVSLQIMNFFNQVLGSNIGDYVVCACVYSAAAGNCWLNTPGLMVK